MTSMGLATRILLTVIIIMEALTIDLCRATATTTAATSKKIIDPTVSLNQKNQESKKEQDPVLSSSLDSPVSPRSFMFSSTSPYAEGELGGRSLNDDIMSLDTPETRLMPDSEESGILLPYEEDFPQPGGDGARRFSGGDQYRDEGPLPETVTFPGKPIALRISNGKALEQPGNDDISTYYLRNNCFGPRCIQQQNRDKAIVNSPEDWKNMYYNNNNNKETKSKKYDDVGGRSNRLSSSSNRLVDNVMESMSSNFHSQVAIPFVVVDENAMKGSTQQSTFSRRNGIDRFSRLTPNPNSPSTTEGWVKLKSISPDAYDPFRFSRNQSIMDTGGKQTTFNKRDSSQKNSNTFSKRVGVEINPESFADRWGWSGNGDNNHHHNSNHNDNRGGSRLPAWLEEQLKYGNRNSNNRNSDQGKTWVKLEPIPVAGVSISKWVPKGTQSEDLPTTNWQTNRDQPNGGNQWWDRIDETNRILTGNRPAPFLRPNGNSGHNNNNHNHNSNHNHNNNHNRFNDGGGWGSKGASPTTTSGSPLSSFDRYPTNSWNDIIYPEGPTSATVSWQQSKGITNQASSFSANGGGGENSGGWSSGSDTRKSIVATGSWSAPPGQNNNRFPSFINRFNDHRPNNYPVKQASEDDPRWVLISNTRRVTAGNVPNDYDSRVTAGSAGNGPNGYDRHKVSSYINRLHPDLDRRNDFPFYERAPSSHRHGKDFWSYPYQGPFSPAERPSKDEAFYRLNATLSTLNPILLHRGGTTVRPPVVGTLRPTSPHYADILQQQQHQEGSSYGYSNTNTDLLNSISSTLSPLLSTYIGDGRATSSDNNAANPLQSSTSTPVRNFNNIPGKIRQGLKNINPVYAAVGAGMIPATLAAVMPMMLGRRKRRDLTNNLISQSKYYTIFYPTNNLQTMRIPILVGCCKNPQ